MKVGYCSAALSYAVAEYTRETMPGAQFYDGKKINIPISDEAGYDLYERWALQGISSVMSAVANERYVVYCSVRSANTFKTKIAAQKAK